jgi:hypothetical protein
MLWVRQVPAAACVPQGTLIAMCGNAARIAEESREVHEVPRHEGRVSVREVVLGTA